MADSSEDEALVAFLMLTRLRKKKKKNRTVWVRPWILSWVLVVKDSVSFEVRVWIRISIRPVSVYRQLSVASLGLPSSTHEPSTSPVITSTKPRQILYFCVCNRKSSHNLHPTPVIILNPTLTLTLNPIRKHNNRFEQL